MSALQVTGLEREFRFTQNGQQITLPDPSPEHTPDQVMNFYSGQYPELTTSTVQGPVYDEDKVAYTFKTTIGTKG